MRSSSVMDRLTSLLPRRRQPAPTDVRELSDEDARKLARSANPPYRRSERRG